MNRQGATGDQVRVGKDQVRGPRDGRCAKSWIRHRHQHGDAGGESIASNGAERCWRNRPACYRHRAVPAQPKARRQPAVRTIKASIRQRGMDAPLKVTRRPGAAHYVVAAGGNTRLLRRCSSQETADRRFETVPVVFKAWCSESDVLAGHLIENEQRSDLTFRDTAQGGGGAQGRAGAGTCDGAQFAAMGDRAARSGAPDRQGRPQHLSICRGTSGTVGPGDGDVESPRRARSPAAAVPMLDPPGAEIRVWGGRAVRAHAGSGAATVRGQLSNHAQLRSKELAQQGERALATKPYRWPCPCCSPC